MGNWLGLPLLALAAILQVTFIPQFRVLGGEPNLVLLLVLSYAVRAPINEGIAWAFAGGILLDLVTSSPTGGTVLGLLLLIVMIDRLRAQIVGIGFLALVGLVIAGTLTLEVTGLILAIIGGYNVRLFDALTYAVLPSIALNLALIFPVYWFVRRICPPPLPIS
jgi:rod shape-determining protein MreD